MRALVCSALLLLAPATLHAQYLTRPAIDWRTLETDHFVVHFPAAMTVWVRDVASRLEAVHDAVTALVGYEPERRVTVMVEDPTSLSNGFALPFRGAPTIFLWPTPPDPTSVLGHYRSWGEILSVHEYAHVAHLLRPSRNPRQELLWRLLPVNVGPLARRAPRWVTEGYATYVEGQLTGSGRPSGVGRAAVLRQWALEGQLPTYGALDAGGRFMGGSMAYLAGSAFLEWLVAREGPQSLTSLWRRMSARADRSFDAAFAGVYGAPPAELYGRFTAELTGRSLTVEDSLQARGPSADSLMQRLGWNTGAPALSTDGTLLAVVLRSGREPSRLVIWRTRDSVDTAAVRRAGQRMMALDSLDVPAVQRRPPAKTPLYTLRAVAGRGYDVPRFMPDSQQVLAVRWVPQGDGTERPDLFLWRFGDGRVTRLTHGAGIREADPSPDGRTAAAVRCENGRCDLVLVDLASGHVRLLMPGTPQRSYFHPRWLSDGRRVLVSVHDNGSWQLALADVDRRVWVWRTPADGADRYGADPLPGDTVAVTTSEAGGIAHLELYPLDGGDSRTLTRTTGAHVLPEASPAGDTVYFLGLHARGYDLRRVAVTDVLGGTATPLPVALAPAIPSPAPPADTFATAPLPASEPYGLGPRRHRVLPGVAAGAEGILGTLVLNGIDPVGRFSWIARGAIGNGAAWRGVSVSAELRTLVPYLRADAFATRYRPATGREGALTRDVAGLALDADYAGGALGASIRRDYGTIGYNSRALVSAGRLHDFAGNDAAEVRGTRTLAVAQLGGGMLFGDAHRLLVPRLSAQLAAGRTLGRAWTRAGGTLDANVRLFGLAAHGRADYAVTSRDPPDFEQLTVGGLASPLVDRALLDQRWAMPALPPALIGGRQAMAWRVDLPLFGVTPYYWSAAAGDRLKEWHRVVGAEIAYDVPSIGFVALPAVHLLVGVARSLDAPFERTRAYATVHYAP